MSAPILIKVGGSLLNHDRGEGLRRLGRVLAEAGEVGPPLFVVPGGGPFADLVRHYGESLRLPQEACHFMALAAMNQYAYVLREHIPGSRTVELGAEDPAGGAGVRILLCSSHYFGGIPEAALPRSWDATSDSIAAYLARELNASLLVLLKSAEVGPALAEPDVDAFFNRLLPLPFPVWFLNGTYPERLARLLRTGRAPGLLLPPNGPPERRAASQNP